MTERLDVRRGRLILALLPQLSIWFLLTAVGGMAFAALAAAATHNVHVPSRAM